MSEIPRLPRLDRLTRLARLTLGALTAGVLAVGLSACQPASNAPASTGETGGSAETAPGQGADPTSPHHIASLSYESTEVLAALGLQDRLAIMPEAVMNEALGSHQSELDGVAPTYAVEKELTAEAVIDVNPDLVIMTPRHGAENTIAGVLEGAGITTLMMPNSWSTPADLVANVRLIGETVGAVDEAEALAIELEEGLVSRVAESAGAADAPRILVLSNQAGRPFITAGTAFPTELVGLAGGSPVGEELGIKVTGPIQVEQVLAANPDGILLVDMNGSGDRLFADVMGNEAVAGLDAVTNDRVLRVQGKEVQALGLTNTIGGLDRLTEWIAEL